MHTRRKIELTDEELLEAEIWLPKNYEKLLKKMSPLQKKEYKEGHDYALKYGHRHPLYPFRGKFRDMGETFALTKLQAKKREEKEKEYESALREEKKRISILRKYSR
jgi:hypothetical protein